MIDLANGHLVRMQTEHPIKKWVVWFMTPFGVTPSLEEASGKCIKADLDPDLNITPVAVAVDNTDEHEIFYPRR